MTDPLGCDYDLYGYASCKSAPSWWVFAPGTQRADGRLTCGQHLQHAVKQIQAKHETFEVTVARRFS
jgi:hypothetical protein